MLLVVENALLTCAHRLGVVGIIPAQRFVTIGGRAVLAAPDPVAKPIVGCPNVGPTIKPCLLTLAVKTGYSDFVSIGGRKVCLDTVKGLTDGTPPGTVDYTVRGPGQGFVTAAS